MNDSTKYNDEQLRRQLENYAEMPSEKVWSGIANALDQKKKKRRLLFWFLLLGGIACGSTVWFLGDTGRSMAGQTAQQREEHTATKSVAPHTTSAAAEKTEPAGKKATAASSAGHSTVSAAGNTDALVNSTPGKGANPAQDNAQQPGSAQTQTHAAENGNNTQTSASPTGREDGSLHTNTGLRPLSAGGETSTAAVTPRRNSATAMEPAGNIPQRTTTSVRPSQNTLRPLGLTPSKVLSLRSEIPQPALLDNQLREGAFFRPALRPVYPKIAPFISLEASAGSVWYNRRAVSDPQNGLVQKNMQSRTSGLYAAGIFKGGFFFGRHGIFSAGMGYEYYGFSNPYALTYSGSPNVGTGSVPETIDAGSYESFGDINIPLPVIDYNGIQKTLNGRLRMQTHNLFFPLDLGARYNFRNFSLGITAGPAFHVLLRQNVYFRNEDGTQLPVDISQPASFNISLGVEPVLAYRMRSWSLFASGGFRYHLLSAVKDPSVRSYPYRANGQLGLRYHLR